MSEAHFLIETLVGREADVSLQGCIYGMSQTSGYLAYFELIAWIKLILVSWRHLMLSDPSHQTKATLTYTDFVTAHIGWPKEINYAWRSRHRASEVIAQKNSASNQKKWRFFCESEKAPRAEPECTNGTWGFEHGADKAIAKKDHFFRAEAVAAQALL